MFWNGYPELTTTLVPTSGVPNSKPLLRSYIHYVGKCDRCGRFHVKCITCGQILSLAHDDENDTGQQCECRTPWFWIASVEQDEHGARSAELLAFLFTGDMITVDWKPLE